MDPRLERTLTFIQKNFRREIHLEDLAAEACLSPFHFHRLFKEKMAETPKAYLRRIRLEYAAHQLALYPQKRISDIATENGFSSLAVFSRAFKQYFQRTPDKFRNRLPSTSLDLGRENDWQAEIVLLPEIPIFFKHSTAYAADLIDTYQNLRIFAQAQKISARPERLIGIFIDMPFHTDLSRCRYYAGIEARLDTHSLKEHECYRIPPGLYVKLPFVGEVSDMFKWASGFKEGWLDPSGYQIKAPIGYEMLDMTQPMADYPAHPKMIYIPVE